MADKSFTGRARKRRTKPLVRVMDGVSRSVITVGGIGTIGAVLLVCIYLFWVSLPLFRPPSVSAEGVIASPWGSSPPVRLGIDEYRRIGWALLPDGTLRTWHADTGEPLSEQKLFGDQAPTAVSFGVNGQDVACGFADGSLRVGRIGFLATFLSPDDVPSQFRNLPPGQTADHEGGVVERTAEGQYRWQRLNVSFKDPVPSGAEAAVLRLSFLPKSDGHVFGVLSGDGNLLISQTTERQNLLTRQVTVKVSSGTVPFEHRPDDLPRDMLLTGLGSELLLIWDDGRAERYDARNLQDCRLAERIDLLEDESARVTAVALLLGRNSVVVGDSLGGIGTWISTKPDHAETVDGVLLARSHVLPAGPAAVTALAPSPRSRVLAAGYADGSVRLFQVTADRLLNELRPGTGPIDAAAIAPKEDGMLAGGADGLAQFGLAMRHPEASWSALFLPVHYEGLAEPDTSWQSTGGSGEEEPKLSITPLVFGTLKATFYSMLFGAPLALLAAIYTSEFLHPRVRAYVKPGVELMASLPSVVLGFLAALILAPLASQFVPALLASFFTVPAAFLTGALLWQLLPQRAWLALQPVRFVGIVLAMFAGMALAWPAGRWAEAWLFQGDLKAWLNGQSADTTGGWMLLLLPLVSVATFVVVREVNTRLRSVSRHWSRARVAVVDIVKFTLAAGVALAVTWFVAAALSASGYDPRGGTLTPLGSFDPRNALVVGLVMGFAIIPIIYTIAEDALASVPEHLRSASLGAGATPWQTATRIVVPTAMSGLFSAVMIGLGRAVGETMIILMAVGATPVKEMNIFNGFRTLAANIATEMPEAVRDSTHYRVLFLSALTLFAITFLVNTVAEVVRLRFRRRAYEL
jgi:phosphate transport system permease protein